MAKRQPAGSKRRPRAVSSSKRAALGRSWSIDNRAALRSLQAPDSICCARGRFFASGFPIEAGMKTTLQNRRGIMLAVLMFVPVLVGCQGPLRAPRTDLCRPWPGFVPVPCRTPPPCQAPCQAPCQMQCPSPCQMQCPPPCQMPVDVCPPICVRPEENLSGPRMGFVADEVIDTSKAATAPAR